MNVSKTKELVMEPFWIKRAPVERLDSFRYLSVCITDDLSWSSYVNNLE